MLNTMSTSATYFLSCETERKHEGRITNWWRALNLLQTTLLLFNAHTKQEEKFCVLSFPRQLKMTLAPREHLSTSVILKAPAKSNQTDQFEGRMRDACRAFPPISLLAQHENVKKGGKCKSPAWIEKFKAWVNWKMRKIISCEGENSFKLIPRNDDTCLCRLKRLFRDLMPRNTAALAIARQSSHNYFMSREAVLMFFFWWMSTRVCC